MKKFLLILATLMLTTISVADTKSALAESCVTWTSDFWEPSDTTDPDYYLKQWATGRIPNVNMTSVSYNVIAQNLDTGYKKTIKGTDQAHNNYWERTIHPEVGWGRIRFTRQLTFKFSSTGETCKSQKHVTDIYRLITD